MIIRELKYEDELSNDIFAAVKTVENSLDVSSNFDDDFIDHVEHIFNKLSKKRLRLLQAGVTQAKIKLLCN